MVRKIVITTCSKCPNRDHSGSFTQGGAKPICSGQFPSRELPYVASETRKGNPDRSPTNEIPDWCPLEEDK